MSKRINRRTVAKGACPPAGVAAARSLLQETAQAAGPPTPEGAPEQSLHDRVGGVFAFSAVVDRFSDAIVANPKLNVNPALKAGNQTDAPTRLPGLKFMRTLWLAAPTGGPFAARLDKTSWLSRRFGEAGQ